jgi:hypothetical protein
VHDVGDPELLLGVIAERLDAREFLPPSDRRPEAERAGPWITASPLATLRLGVAVLLTLRVLRAVTDSDAFMAACAGAMVVVAPHALVRFMVQRDRTGAQSEVGAPPALALGTLAAMSVSFVPRTWAPEAVIAWALTVALVCAMPAWPMPGAYLARRLGRRLALVHDSVGAALVASLGVLCAWLYAHEMILLPTALVAGGLEVAEGAAATRRHTQLKAMPRFRNWPPLALARMRSALRPADVDASDTQFAAGDVVELRDASIAPPPDNLLPLVVALTGVMFAALAAKGLLTRGGPLTRAALGILLS